MDKSCFVIMPISKTVEGHDEDYWAKFFQIIQRVMKGKGYSCIRSEAGPYKLFSKIVKNIENSDIVIAVLTDFNSNVWYELGIRHTLKTGTIMLLQEGQKPPFDVCDFGIIFYKDSIGLEECIKQNIEKYLNKMDPGDCDSPVINILKDKTYSSIEKKMEEMENLVWRLVNEVPRENYKLEKSKTKNKRVLWVDDYPGNNESVMDLFRNKGIRFDIALTTEQGIELYKKESYDLIITDMGRGEQSDAGIALLKELNKLCCKIPTVVYASRKALIIYGNEALHLGAYKIIHGAGNIISFISDVMEL